MTGETKTEAIRKALAERKVRLELRGARGEQTLHRFLEKRIWPQVPPDVLGTRLSKEQEEALLGYGELDE